MARFIKVGRCNMTEDEVCEILGNSEDIAYDSTDGSDSDSEDIYIHNKELDLNVVINDSSDAELDNAIQTDNNIHDSFIAMITNDDILPVDIEENLAQSEEAYTIFNNWLLFASQFKDLKIDSKSSEFEKIIWKKGKLQFNKNQVQFGGDSSLPDYIKNLDTPFQVWSYLFPQSLEENIVLETKKYAGIHTSFDFSVSDLRKYIGILFYMTYYNLPNTRDYWSSKEGRSVQIIQNQMTLQRFEKIRELLHFND